MAVSKKPEGDFGEVIDLLRDILITQLAVAGVPQKKIREIIGGDIYRVSRIDKHIKNAKRGVAAPKG